MIRHTLFSHSAERCDDEPEIVQSLVGEAHRRFKANTNGKSFARDRNDERRIGKIVEERWRFVLNGLWRMT
jgi:hypothetical protein